MRDKLQPEHEPNTAPTPKLSTSTSSVKDALGAAEKATRCAVIKAADCRATRPKQLLQGPEKVAHHLGLTLWPRRRQMMSIRKSSQSITPTSLYLYASMKRIYTLPATKPGLGSSSWASEVRVEDGGEHERLVEDLVDRIAVRLDAHNAVVGERSCTAQLAETTARTRAEVANVVGDLHERDGNSVERTARLDNRIVRRKRLKLVLGGLKGEAGDVGDLGGDLLVKANVGVEAGADGGAALGELREARQDGLDAEDGVVDLLDVAGELLAEGERRGVLEVGASDLDDVVELGALLVEGGAEVLEGGDEVVGDLGDRGDVHGGGEGVVGGLAHVDVVVGVDGVLAAELAAEDLDGAVADDLVDVHVGLGARAGLEDDEGEVGVELAGDDLVGGLADGVSDLGVETELLVDGGGGLLEHAKGLDERLGHALLGSANVKVLEGALGLGAPVAVGGHLERAEGVLFGAELALRHGECGGGEAAGDGGHEKVEDDDGDEGSEQRGRAAAADGPTGGVARRSACWAVHPGERERVTLHRIQPPRLGDSCNPASFRWWCSACTADNEASSTAHPRCWCEHRRYVRVGEQHGSVFVPQHERQSLAMRKIIFKRRPFRPSFLIFWPPPPHRGPPGILVRLLACACACACACVKREDVGGEREAAGRITELMRMTVHLDRRACSSSTGSARRPSHALSLSRLELSATSDPGILVIAPPTSPRVALR
ncbi:hypothetical protein L1887_59065 [Cichorium endivia]|nr:hypothetical protein L1887_59065 [Cichorium endivia]